MAMENTKTTDTTDVDASTTAVGTVAAQEDELAQRLATDREAVQSMQRDLERLTATLTQARKGVSDTRRELGALRVDDALTHARDLIDAFKRNMSTELRDLDNQLRDRRREVRDLRDEAVDIRNNLQREVSHYRGQVEQLMRDAQRATQPQTSSWSSLMAMRPQTRGLGCFLQGGGVIFIVLILLAILGHLSHH